MARRRPLTDGEKIFIEKNVERLTFSEIGRQLGRCQPTVSYYAHSKNLANTSKTERNRWTTEEEDYLLKHYEEDGGSSCAEALGRSIDMVYRKAKQLGVRSYYVRRAAAVIDEQALEEERENDDPCHCGPGSRGKIDTLRQRQGQGLELWNEEDESSCSCEEMNERTSFASQTDKLLPEIDLDDDWDCPMDRKNNELYIKNNQNNGDN